MRTGDISDISINQRLYVTSSLDMPASSINSRCYVPFDEKISTMTTMSGYRKHSSTGSNCSTSSWSTYSPTSTVPPSLTSGRHRSVSPSLTMGYSPSPYQGGGGDPGGHTSPPFGGGGFQKSGTPPPQNHNSCILVNGGQRKLSNSYLRFQRRYSKHG